MSSDPHAGAQAHFDLAVQAHEHGRLEEAVQEFLRAADAEPNFADALLNASIVLARLGRVKEARDVAERALRIAPTAMPVKSQLAVCEHLLSNDAKAIELYESVVAGGGASPLVLGNLALSLFRAGRRTHAIAVAEKAIALDPSRPIVWNNFGRFLHEDGRLLDACAAFERACALQPNYVQALSNWASSLKSLGRVGDAIATYDRALRVEPSHGEIGSNRLLALHYDPAIDGETLLREHRAWAERQRARILPMVRQQRSLDPERPLRVGFLSPDFRTHSVACFLEPLLRALDPNHIVAVAYAEVARPDETTRRMQGLVSTWRSTVGESSESVARMVDSDAVDVLIDLASHTDRNRIDVLFYEAAPVQLSYLGYPSGTGISGVERLTDRWADPPEHRNAGEAIRYIEEGFLLYAPPQGIPARRARASNGRAPILGCFNVSVKVNPVLVGFWCEAMRELPGAELWLKSAAYRDRDAQASYLSMFEAHGIGRERVRFFSWDADRTAHLARYGEIDVALDTYPYHGTTTTCEALAMGVPVITLAGGHHAARVGVSLLTRVGLKDLVAQSPGEYVRKIVGLATDKDRLAELHASLPEQIARGSLCDAARFAKNFQATLREAWRDYAARAQQK